MSTDMEVITAAEEAKIRAAERARIDRQKAEQVIRKDERQRALQEGLSEAEAKARAADEEARAKARKEQERTSNVNFVQVYPKGWERIRALIAKNKSAAILYAYLAEHIDPAAGAVVASQDLLSEETGISRTTIWRASKYLEEVGALIRLKVSGQVYAYCLDPSEVWKAWDTAKKTAAFNTKTIVKKADQEGSVKRRIQVLMKEQQGEPELPFGDDE